MVAFLGKSGLIYPSVTDLPFAPSQGASRV
jgi:hypothetical protein